MFDSLRRAEAERRRKSEAAVGDGAPMISIPRDLPPLHAAMPASLVKPSTNGHVPMNADLSREIGILRNAIESLIGKQTRRTILFVGSVHGEGATTLAQQYARVVAASGERRVLLVEVNARSPFFSQRYGLSGRPGIGEYFERPGPLARFVHTPDESGVDVIHVGTVDATRMLLHAEKDFERFLEEAQRHYDSIVVDAPPVSLSPETPALCAAVDGVVLVVQSGRTKREIVQRSLKMIRQFDGRLLGIVLNRKKYYIPGFIYRNI